MRVRTSFRRRNFGLGITVGMGGRLRVFIGNYQKG
jgi:hypothetical protein